MSWLRLLAAGAALLGSGCGVKGPLYLPEKGGTVVTTPAAPVESPAPEPAAVTPAPASAAPGGGPAATPPPAATPAKKDQESQAPH